MFVVWVQLIALYKTLVKMVVFASLILIVAFISVVTSAEILVERRKDYDQILWDGDCSRINGIYATLNGTKMCVCKMSGLHGTIFPDDVGFVTCFYGHSKTG